MDGDNRDSQINISDIVVTHLNALQSIIQRLAGNSASCKTWCIGILVGAYSLRQGTGEASLTGTIALTLMVVILGALDAYYLYLEREYRQYYCSFVEKAFGNRLSVEDFDTRKSRGGSALHRAARYLAALRSCSIWPFYGALVVIWWYLFRL